MKVRVILETWTRDVRGTEERKPYVVENSHMTEGGKAYWIEVERFSSETDANVYAQKFVKGPEVLAEYYSAYSGD